MQRLVDEEITLHTEHTVTRWTAEHTFILQLCLTCLTEPVSLEVLHWTLYKSLEGEEVVKGSGEMGGRHQSQTTHFTLHRKLSVSGVALRTEISSQRQTWTTAAVQMRHAERRLGILVSHRGNSMLRKTHAD